VIAPQGTAFTADQARLLKRYVETVLLCFDSDAAGKKAADRSVPSLLSQGLTVKIISLPAGEDPDSLIRKHGPAAFLKLVESAKEYFDHSLAEAVASGELEDTTGKSRLVRRLAPPLALVQDAVLREALLGRISTRLGISPASIRAGMKAPIVERDSQDTGQQVPPDEVISLTEGMKMLGQLVLASSEVREWLRTQPPLAEFESQAAILDKLARADFSDHSPLSAALISELSGAEERFLSSLETLRTAPNPLQRAKSTIYGLRIRQFEQSIDELKSRVGDSSLPLGERQKIQKQILDLKIRMHDLHRPFDQE
jgi:DNA primase